MLVYNYPPSGGGGLSVLVNAGKDYFMPAACSKQCLRHAMHYGGLNDDQSAAALECVTVVDQCPMPLPLCKPGITQRTDTGKMKVFGTAEFKEYIDCLVTEHPEADTFGIFGAPAKKWVGAHMKIAHPTKKLLFVDHGEVFAHGLAVSSEGGWCSILKACGSSR